MFPITRSIVAIAVVAILLGTIPLAAIQGDQKPSAAFASAERKIQWIAENGASDHPAHHPTVLTAAEWNAYLNEGGVKLPEGVSSVRLTSQPAVVYGDAEVDFDRFTSNRTRNNPLLQLFTGKHHVTVTAQASAANGVGTIRVDSVEFDGVEIPRIALEYFCNRYVRPKYGNAVSTDATFPLHARIDSATLGADQVTIIQR